MKLLTWVKTSLSHIPNTSLRYKMVKMIWKEKRVDHTKACTFYWVMLSTSVLGLIFFGFILAFAFVLIGTAGAIGFFFGFTITIISEKTPKYGDTKTFYPYKYRPRTGMWSRFVPWHFVVPFVGMYVLYRVGTSDVPSTASEVLKTGSGFVATNLYWELGILAIVPVCYLIGRAAVKRQLNLRAKWDELYPPLVVEAKEKELVS